MFCSNYGKNLKAQSKFCEHCGSEADTPHVTDETINQPEKNTLLENKAWYRALKVIYIICIILATIMIGAVSWSSIPKKTLDGDKSSIVCDNGKSYAPNRNDISLYSWEDSLSYTNDLNARILCKYDTLNFYRYSNEKIEKNYHFYPSYNPPEGTGEWFGYTILAFIILWILAVIVKIIFLYIVIGKKPKINI